MEAAECTGGRWNAPVRPVLVVEGLELAQRVEQVALVPGQGPVQQFARQVCTQRSMIELVRGIHAPVSTILMPASARTASNSSGNLPSRSRINHCARHPASSKSMTRFLAACVTHAAVG